MLLYVLSVSVLIYVMAFVYIFNVMFTNARENAIELTNSIAEKYASIAGSELNQDVAVTRTLKYAHTKYPAASPEERIDYYDPILKQTLLNHPKYLSVWTTWELESLSDDYDKPYGRSRTAFYREGGITGKRVDTVNLDGDQIASLYYKIKSNPREVLVNPYYDNYSGEEGKKILMASVVVPLFVNEKFAGLAGLDVGLQRFQYLAKSMAKIEGSHAFFVSNNGNFVAFSDKNELITKALVDFFGADDERHKLSKKVAEGENFNFYFTNNSTEYYVKMMPFAIGESQTPWSVGIMIPTDRIMNKIKSSGITFTIGSIVAFIILFFVVIRFSIIITRPLNETNDVISKLAKGDIDRKMKMTVKSKDEIGDMRKALNELIEHLNITSDFASKIGEGSLDYEYEKRSEKDILGNALIGMKENLNRAEEERKQRAEEDQKLNWATGGTAKFADILRRHSDNLNELAYEIISELVKYLDAEQGGLFILNEDEKTKKRYIDLIGSYAFDRKKMLSKRIPYGVGLVGRCIQEAETIYISRVPEEYLHITSGLGDSKPQELTIVPLIFNQEVFGAVEITSLTPLEEYKIKFLEQIGESIASTISMVNINVKTAKLLEETKIKSEQMASQEEEIRQNMEEMKSSQEELSEQVSDFESTLDALKEVSYITEYDPKGRITDINDRFLDFLKKEKSEIIGKYQGTFSTDHQKLQEFNKFWDQLRKGKIKHYEQDVYINEKAVRIKGIYSPVKDKDGKVYKVISMTQVPDG